MSFPRYPKYKESGAEWIGEVPEHWEVKPLYGTVVERAESNEGMIEDNLLSLSYGRIVPKDITSNDGLLPESFETYQIVKPGDIVFRLTDLQNDKRSLRSAIVEETGIITFAYLAVTPRGANSRYMSHLFRAYDASKVFYSMGGGLRQSMKFADLKRMPTLLPPPTEQTRIAEFLDQETMKIDGLVVEQQRLMELLKEKRQAVISHAVTRGLNTKVLLNPSGIEWLGDVPAHWQLKKIKHLVRSIEQGWSPQCESFPAETESEWGVLKVGCVNGGTFNPSENKLLPPEFEPIPSLGIARDDLLISRANTRELVGSAAIVERDYPNLMLCDKLYRLRFDLEKCNPRFVSHYLCSSVVRGEIELGATGASASMLNIPQSAIMELVIALPPLDEQLEIVASLDRGLSKFDTLTAEAQRAIDLLQERRTALISAAVTGQIDVRPINLK